MTALFVSHYLYVVGALQVVGGLLLFSGRWMPLGLTLLGPVIVNIVCFHVLMAPAGLPMAIVVSFLALFLLWRYREHFAGLVKNGARHSRNCPVRQLRRETQPLSPDSLFRKGPLEPKQETSMIKQLFT